MGEYESAARDRRCTFVPIILSCAKDENLKRLESKERWLHGKLTDTALVSYILDNEGVHKFKDHPLQMELDVTHIEPMTAARLLYNHVLKVCIDLNAGLGKEAITDTK